MKANLGENHNGRILLKDRAYSELKEHILSDRYPPGTFLAERSLAAELGMSKTPVKAALERLELEGFVVISPQQCVLVRELSPREIAEQYEIRTALESYVVKTMAGKLTAEQRCAIVAQLEEQRLSIERGSIAEQVELDAAFHMMLAEQLGNQTILRVMADLRDRVHRVITRAFRLSPERFKASYREHIEIAEAIFDGRGEEAASLIWHHLERGRRIDAV